MELDLSIKACA